MTTVDNDIMINDTPLSEAQRQMLLLALAVLAQRSPGFDPMLTENRHHVSGAGDLHCLQGHWATGQ